MREKMLYKAIRKPRITMAKKRHLQDRIIPQPEADKRYKRTMDMSDQEYARLLNDARNLSIGYWIFIITTAIITLVIGILITRRLGLTVGGVTFLSIGAVLLILIIARIIRDVKERS